MLMATHNKPDDGTVANESSPPAGGAPDLFETEFTSAFTARFLVKGPKALQWPDEDATSVQRLRDLDTFARLLLSGAQV